MGDTARAWPLDRLARAPAFNDEVAGAPVLVAFDRASVTARLYERKLGERVLTFRLANGKLTDRETGTTWEPITGRAVAGALEGKNLTPLPAIVSYRDIWQGFHPNSVMGRPK